MKASILEFPKNKIVRHAPTEDIQQKMRANRMKFFDMLSMSEANEVLSGLYSAGINVKDPVFVSRFSLGMEFIRSAIYGVNDEAHPFHEVADNLIKNLNAPKIEIQESDMYLEDEDGEFEPE